MTTTEHETDEAMLIAEAVEKTFSAQGPTSATAAPLAVLCGVDLHVARGRSVVIMGPSGSGKSTLLNILGTLEPPSAGRVRIDGQDPFQLDDRALAAFRNRRIGFVFQEHHLLPHLSVLDNALLPTLAGGADRGAGDRARELLNRVGLADRLDHLPGALSGGERQRVAIVRALINRPALVLADEPTGNLDRATARDVADVLLSLNRSEGTTLVTVTHSEALACRFDGRYELVGGRLERRTNVAPT